MEMKLVFVDTPRVNEILEDVKKQLRIEAVNFNCFESPHEGYGVILEHSDKVWEAIKARNEGLTATEMVGLIAVCVRYLHDLYDS